MRPVFAKIPEDVEHEVFAVRVADRPYFSTEFHFHNECQITYVVESEGKRIIGDSVEHFKKDELIMLGSDLPHVWHNEERYFENNPANHARSITVFFDPVRLVESLKFYGPMKDLENLLFLARRGMLFSGTAKKQLKQLLFALAGQQGLERLITFMRMLEILTHTTEYQLLASSGYVNTYQARDNDRMDRVFKYVLNNFTGDIQLDDIAMHANMNKQAFCRYFKSRTQKTFIRFVNEIRIGHACKLMADRDYKISGLAYDCGYNSLSNFNRFFKEIKGITPKEYKKMIG